MLCGTYTLSSITYLNPTQEYTMPGETAESISVTYHAITLKLRFNSGDMERHNNQLRASPSHVVLDTSRSTFQIVCFGFHEDSCAESETNRIWVTKLEAKEIIDDLIFRGRYNGQIFEVEKILVRVLELWGQSETNRTIAAGRSLDSVDLFLDRGDKAFVGFTLERTGDSGYTYNARFLYTSSTMENFDGYSIPIYMDVLGAFRGDITELGNLETKYLRNPFKDLAQRCCHYLKRSFNATKYDSACEFAHLMKLIVMIVAPLKHYETNQPRNLHLTYEFNTQEALRQASQALQFRNVLIEIQITQQLVIDTKSQLGNLFATTAAFERRIAENDKEFIKGELNRLNTGITNDMSEFRLRISRMLNVSYQVKEYELGEASFNFGLKIAENLNPLKLAVEGPDIDEITESFGAIASAASEAYKAEQLYRKSEQLKIHLDNIHRKFGYNRIQIQRLLDIVEPSRSDYYFNTQLKDFADEFIAAYGDYTPMVTSQDITYLCSLLRVITTEGCAMIETGDGPGSSFARSVEANTNHDCIYLPAIIDGLQSHYEEVFDFQFALIDSLTAIARGTIAENLANKLAEIDIDTEERFDMKLASIGTALYELEVQNIARKHCDYLEYQNAGERTSECEPMFFTLESVNNITNQRITAQSSYNLDYAFLPTSKPNHADERGYPYINLTQLLETGTGSFQLPTGTQYGEFLQTHRWPNPSGSTRYVVQLMEAFVPGLQCTNSNDYGFEMTMMSGELSTLLPGDPSSQYLIPPANFTFVYNKVQGECGRGTKGYNIRRDDSYTHAGSSTECIVSFGNYSRADDLYPSMFNTWTLFVGKRDDNCEFTNPRDVLGYDPMITFRYEVKAVTPA